MRALRKPVIERPFGAFEERASTFVAPARASVHATARAGRSRVTTGPEKLT
jgi:hypothetical protein